MAYTTAQKVKLRARRALTSEEDENAFAQTIPEGIEWAMERIDGKLRAKATQYALPFPAHPNTPKLIQSIASDLAAYWALVEVFSGGADETATNLAHEIRDRGMADLESLVEGGMELPPEEGGTPTNEGGSAFISHDKPGLLSRFDLVNVPDPGRFPLEPFR